MSTTMTTNYKIVLTDDELIALGERLTGKKQRATRKQINDWVDSLVKRSLKRSATPVAKPKPAAKPTTKKPKPLSERKRKQIEAKINGPTVKATKKGKTCEVCIPPSYVTKKGRKAPEWAMKLVAKELAGKYRKVMLVWNVKSNDSRVSGLASYCGKVFTNWGSREVIHTPTLTITCGKNSNERAVLSVLLHEIAHFLAPSGEHHGLEFCKQAVKLYRKHGLLEELATGKIYVHYASERKEIQKAFNRSNGAKARRVESQAAA